MNHPELKLLNLVKKVCSPCHLGTGQLYEWAGPGPLGEPIMLHMAQIYYENIQTLRSTGIMVRDIFCRKD